MVNSNVCSLKNEQNNYLNQNYMKYYVLTLLFIFGISSAQQNEKYQIYIVKITKFKNGT